MAAMRKSVVQWRLFRTRRRFMTSTSTSTSTTSTSTSIDAAAPPQFHVVAHEYGHSGRPLPTWACSKEGNLRFNAPPPTTTTAAAAATTCRDLSSYVPGCFQLLNVLSADECAQICSILNTMQWDQDAPVSLPYSFRHMENCNWLVHDNIVKEIWGRATKAMPPYATSVAKGADAVGLNARFRCYKYSKGDYFKPHTDGSWPGSGLSENGQELVWDRYPGERWSQFTFLLLLTEGYSGGRTIFYPTEEQQQQSGNAGNAGNAGSSQDQLLDELNDVVEIDPATKSVAVRTPMGAALCFPHGGHPDHAKHAGELVQQMMGGGAQDKQKIMIRTEILYTRTDESDELQKHWFRSGSGATVEK